MTARHWSSRENRSPILGRTSDGSALFGERPADADPDESGSRLLGLIIAGGVSGPFWLLIWWLVFG